MKTIVVSWLRKVLLFGILSIIFLDANTRKDGERKKQISSVLPPLPSSLRVAASRRNPPQRGKRQAADKQEEKERERHRANEREGETEKLSSGSQRSSSSSLFWCMHGYTGKGKMRGRESKAGEGNFFFLEAERRQPRRLTDT